MSDPKAGSADVIARGAKTASLSSHSIDHKSAPIRGSSRTWMLTLGALGVVYGDIGTSPLYAFRQSVLAAGGAVPNSIAIFGALSLIFWSLIIVVTIKYVILIMRADNQGEGGVLALAVLAQRISGLNRSIKSVIGLAAILGLALFYGDGMLTPAISVLSAVEQLTVENNELQPLVVPLTLAILIAVFMIQSRGTTKIGRLFGPVMLVWFATLATLGTLAIIRTPMILMAINPYYAISLFQHEPWTAFVALGSVVLAITGCEALYADMGHFGKRPIRYAWFYLVLPALLINYFGQGAAILRDPHKADVAFFSVVPNWAHFPMILLSTVATIIASQAVISGIYSITRQAVQLGLLPRMEIRHTSAVDPGQVYVPRINGYLCLGVVLIVLIFRSSGALAAAYGIAVTGVMVISTFLVTLVAARQWNWDLKIVITIFGLFGLIDMMFFYSNALKIMEGGWFPVFIAACIFLLIETWRIGRLARIRNESLSINLFLARVEKASVRVPGTAVFLASRSDSAPGALLHNLKHNKVLHERVLLVHVTVADTPFISTDKRIEVEKLGKGFFNVVIHHGFFETPDVPLFLQEAHRFGLAFDIETTTFFIGHETLVPSEHSALGPLRTWLYMKLASSELSPAHFYQLPPGRVVELGTQVSI